MNLKFNRLFQRKAIYSLTNRVTQIQLKTIIPMKTFDLLQMPSKYYLIESFIGISYMLLPRKHMIFESTTASFNKCENINSPDKSQ